jgi:hypothetical protein
MNAPAMEALVQRLEKVEQQNRKLKMVGVVVLSLAVAGMVMGQAMPRARIVEAEGFVLKDGAGKVRAELSVVKDGSQLTLGDENGTTRVALIVGKVGPLLALADETGKFRAWLVAHKDGPVLNLLDENGKVVWSAP